MASVEPVEPGSMPVKKMLFVVTGLPEDIREPNSSAGFYRGNTHSWWRYGGAQHGRLFGFINFPSKLLAAKEKRDPQLH